MPLGQGLHYGSQPANQMLLEEAYRTVAIREGDKVIELPVIKAVFRSLGVSAMKGNRLAQAVRQSMRASWFDRSVLAASRALSRVLTRFRGYPEFD